MDRLLRYFLKQFIRRGSMTFTTASGAKFTCGDGTGEPVSARFLTTDGERRILLNPELALGELYMEGTFVVERGSIADVLAILLDPAKSRRHVRENRVFVEVILDGLGDVGVHGFVIDDTRARRIGECDPTGFVDLH